jgi:hypothetical protein
MTELQTLSRELDTATTIVPNRMSGRPELALRWQIDDATGKPVCHWIVTPRSA